VIFCTIDERYRDIRDGEGRVGGRCRRIWGRYRGCGGIRGKCGEIHEKCIKRSQGNEGKVWRMQEDLREVQGDAVVSEGRIEIYGKCKGIPDRHLREMEGRYRGVGGGSEGDKMKWGGNWGRCRGRSAEDAGRSEKGPGRCSRI
jgi:hypothetical protein